MNFKLKNKKIKSKIGQKYRLFCCIESSVRSEFYFHHFDDWYFGLCFTEMVFLRSEVNI